jgi:phosphatidylinositol phospholipase C gamma-1
MFDSLYSLIMYYRTHPLKGTNFSMVLKEPVPQPQSHEGKE